MRLPAFLRTPTGAIGTSLLAFMLVLAIAGPLLAPHSVSETIGAPATPPYGDAPLGTDGLGRDVFSRVLHGGLTVVLLGLLATVIAYFFGLIIGMIAGYKGGLVDAVLMRGVDVLLAFPGLVLLLLLIGGLGTGPVVLILGVVLIKVPTIARIIRTATLEASTRGFVEAAVARGEKMPAVLTREIIPSIAPLILADFGIRFGYAVATLASVNYLGLGLAPPTADWGLMIAENRDYSTANVWAVLAPAFLLALLTIAVCLTGDAYARSLGRTADPRRRRASAVRRHRRAANGTGI